MPLGVKHKSVIAHPVTGGRDMTRFMPGWTDFFQRINDARDDARAAGKNFSVRFGGGGRGSMTSLSRASGGDVDADAGNAWNAAQPSTLERDGALASLRRLELGNQAMDEQRSLRDRYQNPYHRQKMGDLERSEQLRDATAAGEAASAEFHAATPMRDTQRYEANLRARDLGYHDPAVEKARLEADSRRREQAAQEGRTRSAAITAFAKLAEQAAGVEPEIEEVDPDSGINLGPLGRWGQQTRKRANPAFDAIQRSMDELRGQMGGAEQAEDRGVTLSMDDIAEVAQKQGWTLEQAIEEAKRRGYAVQ